MAKTVKKNTTQKKATPHCPYCDVELVAMNLPFCQACHVTILYCADCGKPLPKNQKTCPSCGAKVIS
jgi:predicted amidophosphoribosyltransferase